MSVDGMYVGSLGGVYSSGTIVLGRSEYIGDIVLTGPSVESTCATSVP